MRTMHGATTPSAAWPPHVPPPTLSERRSMKKAAQPEHSYTGHIPQWLHEADDNDPTAAAASHGTERTRHAPILGYSGHLRHVEDRVGTTFSKGLEIARQPEAAAAGPLTRPPDYGDARSSPNNNRHHHTEEPVKHVKDHNHSHRHATKTGHGRGAAAVASTKRVEFADERAAETHGDFQAKPMSARSGYGAFDGASGYGEFAAKPMSARSGYGAFDGASGYGEFAAKPMSARYGYGAFDGASGYGEFQAKPMSARSGYGAFDGASGYGEFAAKPMSARSGYGAFDGASGYGEFMAPTPREAGGGNMSARSGYGEFDGASGYGAFAERPEIEEDDQDDASGYGAFDNASGYGEFMAAPPSLPKKTEIKTMEPRAAPSYGAMPPATRPPIVIKRDDSLDRKYQCALRAVGGEANVAKLLGAFATTIAQRHHKRTELLQAIKRSFEKHEQQNQGKMTKAQVKEALQGLSCVFTDDQIMALMAVYDPECRGYVSMDALLTDLTRRVVS